MLMLVLTIIILIIYGAGILRLLAKIFLIALILTFSAETSFFAVLAGMIFLLLQKLIPFVAKNLARVVSWIISEIVTMGLLIYAVGRKFFYDESIIDFIKKLIPHKDESSRRTDFSLLVTKLADSIQEDIVSKLKPQYKKAAKFLTKPLYGDEKN